MLASYIDTKHGKGSHGASQWELTDEGYSVLLRERYR